MRVGPPCWGQCPGKMRKGHPSSLPPGELPPGLSLLAPACWLPVSRTVGDERLLPKPPSRQWAARAPAHLHGARGTGGREDAERRAAAADGQGDRALQATEPGKEALLPWPEASGGGRPNQPGRCHFGDRTWAGPGTKKKKKKMFTCHLPRYAWSPRICHWGWPSGSSCTTSHRDASGHSC